MKNKITLLVMSLLFSTAIYAQEKRETKFIKLDESAKHQLQDADQLLRENLQLSSDDQLVPIKTETDQLGFTHEKLQQYFKGLKVEFGTYMVHAKNGTIKTMNGELFFAGKLNTTPLLSKEAAFQRAISHTGADHYLWEYPEAAKEMDNYTKPEGELLILPGEITGKSIASLAYKFDIYATAPVSRGYLYIDAHNGEALFFNAIIKHAEKFGHIGEVKAVAKIDKAEVLDAMFVAGTGQTRYSGTQTIETAVSGSNYILSDAGRKVYTRDALNQAPGNTYPYISNYSQFTDNDNNWTSAEHSANKDDAALDAHWGAAQTFDYFNSEHNRNSYDGNGAQIRSYVHVDNNYDNAFWNGSVMSYGDGSSNGNEGNGNFDALTSIDVAAHEIGHAVCSFTADLAYQRESGGLNEGFSDIWGAAVEHFAKGNGNDAAPSAAVWLIGDEIDRRSGSVGLRSMSNPNERSQPDTYGGTYWQNPNCGTPTNSNDYCGVHTNSGVLNHWFYLLTVGGSGTNDVSDSYNVNSIGMTKSAKIAYRTESVYLSANSTFANARTGAIQSAEDLYGAGSQEVISTTNAWYAVGVGAEYVQTCSLPAPSSLASSNIADTSFTMSWNSVSGAASYTVTANGSTSNTSGTSFNVTGLTAGTQYTVSVVANCSTGGNGVSSSINVTTSGTAPVTYCNSASTNINDEYIGRVQLGSIDNASGGQFYTDFTSVSTNLTKGTSASITVTPTWTGTVYSEGYSVWIDYNKDGDFTDSGEQVWSQAATQATPVSGSFTVPAATANGTTRMRVSMKYNGVPTSCETFTYGEVEDYTVNIISGAPDTTAPVITLSGASTINLEVGDTYNELGATATDDIDGNLTSSIVITGTVNTNVAGTYTKNYNVSDAAGNAATQVSRTVNVTEPAGDTQAPTTPTSLTASNITQTTASLSWNASSDNVGVTGYEVFSSGTSIGTVTSNGASITGLIANTSYTYTVSAFDAAGNSSASSNSVTFTTLSDGGGNSTTTLHEGFFESGWNGWSDGGSDCYRDKDSRSYEGNYSIRLRDNSGTGSAMTSSAFNLSGYDIIEVQFYFYAYSMENGEDFWLRYNNGSGWTTVASWARGTSFENNGYYTATVNLSSADYTLASNGQFRFQCDASSNNDQIYIDQVTIKGIIGTGIVPNTIESIGGNNGITTVSDNDEGYEYDFKMYPNPAKQILNVELLDGEEATYKIVNILGQTVKSGDLSRQEINVSSLEAGLYIIEVNDGEEKMIRKFIKE